MGLNSFVAKDPRPLPIFILADTSGSMRGEKINELNLAMREMLKALNDEDDIRGKFQLSIITFGGDVKMIQPLEDIDKIVLPELTAAGKTPLGEAVENVAALIEDRTVVSSRAYTPTIVLISDGIPTDCPREMVDGSYDDWTPLKNLRTGERSSKCQRLALAVGDEANTDMLRTFVGNPDVPVIKANGASGITKFFQWVTMSTVARMHSMNPNVLDDMAPLFDIDEDGIVI